MQSIGRGAEPQKKLKRAICCSGGGSHLIIGAGYLKRIYELKAQVDMLLGTSSGALLMALYAQGDIDLIEWLCLNISNRDIKAFAPWKLFTPDACVYDSTPLLKTLRKYIDMEKIYKRGLPLYVARTNALNHRCSHYALHTPRPDIDPHKVLLASTAIPGLFPPVDNCWFDGGLTDNFNAEAAVTFGATDIIMLHLNKPRPLALHSILDLPEIMFSNMGWSAYTREVDAIERMDPKPRLRTVLPGAPKPYGMFDFNFGGLDRKELIQAGYDLAKRCLG